MKTKLLLSALLSFSFYLLSSQVPQGFNYQAIARDGSGNPITGQTMQVKIGILSDTIANTMVWEELFNPVKTNAFGMFNIVVGTGVKQSGSAGTFSAIDWTKTPLFLRTSIYYPSSWKLMGTSKLQSVPYSMVAGNLEGSVPLLSVKGSTTTMDSALFVVRNNTGQIVFAVYNEGVRIYVDDGKAKGTTKGGFAIGSFDRSKGTSQPLFIVDPDSIRAYLDNNPVKAVKGGFAIGGFDRSKSPTQNFLIVSKDSVRVYIDDNLTKASTKGGFAIGSFDKSKGGNANYFNVSPDSVGRIYPSQNRILWYPLKNALLTGKVIADNKDSVGVNSFASGYESRSKGKYSQALGYRAIARGDYSTAVGKNALANKINSFAFGDSARALNWESYAIGRGANSAGYRSFAFGSAGVDSAGIATGVTYAGGDYSFAVGQGSKAKGKGAFAIGLSDSVPGDFSLGIGYKNISKGYGSTAVGWYSNANGTNSIAIGCYTNSNSYGSVALGGWTNANGWFSTAMGCTTQASNSYSTAMGCETNAKMTASTAMGYSTVASGMFTTSMGCYTTANSYNCLVIGQYNDTTSNSWWQWDINDPLFIIGNGTDNSTRSNALTVLKNGNIGIGFTSPSLKLEVNGSIKAVKPTGSAFSSGQFQAWTDGSSQGLKAVYSFYPTFMGTTDNVPRRAADIVCGFNGGSWTNEYLTFNVGLNGANEAQNLNLERMRITGSGNVGIGTTTPQFKLEVVGSGTPVGALIRNTSSIGYTTLRLYNDQNINTRSLEIDYMGSAYSGGEQGSISTTGAYPLNLGTASTPRITILSSGNVGIGTTTPVYKLTIFGTAWCSSGAWTGSDIRWKKNISEINDILSNVLTLRPVTYQWKTDEFPEMNFTNGAQIGLIAQDVEKVFPNLVMTDNNGYKAVSYEKLSVVLLEGMKEQQKEIDTYKSEIQSLHEKVCQIESQQKEIDELKALVNSLVANHNGQGNK